MQTQSTFNASSSLPYQRVAILVDGAWFSQAVGRNLQPELRWPSASCVYENAISVLNPNEVLFRLYYYDTLPFAGTSVNPISKATIDYAATPSHHARLEFFRELAQKELVALRKGEVRPRGWRLRDTYEQDLLKGNSMDRLEASDIYIDFEQKGIDVRIGVDIATLALKRIVDRVILISGDSDMLPAMQLARVEGMQVIMVQVGTWMLNPSLIEEADFVRQLQPVWA
jgi:uncharacterized LabA/DUF88 family protein